MDVEKGENLEIDGLVRTAEVYAQGRDARLRACVTVFVLTPQSHSSERTEQA